MALLAIETIKEPRSPVSGEKPLTDTNCKLPQPNNN